jgi:hypothetical protein
MTTLMAQSAVGYIVGNFVLIVSMILIFPGYNNASAVLFLPVLLILAPFVGAPAGLSIWAASQFTHRSLNWIFRTVIATATVAVAWLLLAGIAMWSPLELWVLAAILLPALGISVVTGSRLRLWHELARRADPVGPVLRVFSSASGVVLRTTVVFLFMASCIALVGILQSSYYQQIDRTWALVSLVHFTPALALVFVRMKTEWLLPLAVIVNVPVVVRLVTPPDLVEPMWYVALCYLALWTVFLLTRWRQTQVALSVVEEEFRYYLIE